MNSHINDRLSSLPDTLLITILSLLPTNSAAATSVLSHRWRRLWTHITHFSFEPWKVWKHGRNLWDFMNTINHILFQLSSSKLHTFHLHIPTPYPYIFFPDQGTDTVHTELRDCLACIVPWIHLVCQRNPEVIKVTFHNPNPIRLHDLPPVRFLQTESLVKLELIANIELKFPDYLVVNLPNLKKLHINLYDSQRRVMATLFRSCPILEDLYLGLHLNEHEHFVNISAPNLKDLYIDMGKSSFLSLHSKFVIDAPKLERFVVEGVLALYDFVTNPSNLQLVTIALQKMDGNKIDNDYFLNVRLGLFRGISCVRSLTLLGDCGITLLNFLNRIDLPIYLNLVYLRFNCVDESHMDLVHNGRPQLPSSWLANLQKIEVSVKIKNVLDMNLLTDILSSATALEQLGVSPLYKGKLSPRPTRLWNEYNFCRELFQHPRSSPSCQIEFSGKMITASSNDYSYGALTCQILE